MIYYHRLSFPAARKVIEIPPIFTDSTFKYVLLHYYNIMVIAIMKWDCFVPHFFANTCVLSL